MLFAEPTGPCSSKMRFSVPKRIAAASSTATSRISGMSRPKIASRPPWVSSSKKQKCVTFFLLSTYSSLP